MARQHNRQRLLMRSALLPISTISSRSYFALNNIHRRRVSAGSCS